MIYLSSKRLFFLILALYALLLACGSPQKIRNMPARERLDHAMKLFENKKNLRASTEFKILVLNSPGSSFIDTAQFHLAECYFNMKEFITAAAEYEKLMRVYPRSNYIDDAQYKIGYAYFRLSPKPALDQQYTFKAIDAFQQFLDEFPESKLVPEVIAKLAEAQTKLAKKEFNTGELYRGTAFWEAAINSYDDVLKLFFDTKYAEDAYYWRAYCLLRLDKFDDARATLQIFISKFPESSYSNRAKSLALQIEAEEKRAQAETTANGVKN